MAEQMELTALPEPKTTGTAKKQAPKWQEPTDLPPGAVGGIVADRSDLIKATAQSWWAPNLQLRHFWSPRTGQVTPWFDIRLQSKQGEIVVSLSQDELYNLSYGDWVTVLSSVQDNKHFIGRKIEVTHVPRDIATMSMDVHWIGPATQVEAEGLVGRGFSKTGHPVLFQWQAYQKYFGRINRGHQVLSVVPFDALSVIGGSYYDVLGLEPPYEEEELKTAFRQKSKDTHPDLHPDDESAGTRFQEIKEAYDMLKDPTKRMLYDMAMSMTTHSFSSGIDTLDVYSGKHKEIWYPPITSGVVTGKAISFGNTTLFMEITNIEKVRKGAHTRVAAHQDGMVTLLWADGI